MKVDMKNTYYVGMKTLTSDKPVQVNVSGLAMEDPQTILVRHTTDLYYEVTPLDGYIVIQNASQDGALLSLTKLRTTNMYAVSANSGVLPIQEEEVMAVMAYFDGRIAESNVEVEPEPEQPSTVPELETIEKNKLMASRLFATVQTWLQDEKGGAQ